MWKFCKGLMAFTLAGGLVLAIIVTFLFFSFLFRFIGILAVIGFFIMLLAMLIYSWWVECVSKPKVKPVNEKPSM